MVAHVMIDLETMGQGHDAAITQIGAVKFDPIAGTLDPNEFSANVRLDSSVAAGLKIDASTVAWWMGQSEKARQHLTEAGQAHAISLSKALYELGNWLGDPKEIGGVWAHGTTFDLPILNTAYRTIKRSPPWGFRAARDTRTLFWLVEPINPWPAEIPGEVKHNAVDDARRQAKAVINAIKILHGLQSWATGG